MSIWKVITFAVLAWFLIAWTGVVIINWRRSRRAPRDLWEEGFQAGRRGTRCWECPYGANDGDFSEAGKADARQWTDGWIVGDATRRQS